MKPTMKRPNLKPLAVLVFATATTLLAANGTWLNKVPETERTRVNPMDNNAATIAAGAKLFQHHCASCHGTDAQGLGSRPGLLSSRVHDATEGELEWLLRNGSMARGMPSWSRLPEPQRWQLVRYLHTLPER